MKEIRRIVSATIKTQTDNTNTHTTIDLTLQKTLVHSHTRIELFEISLISGRFNNQEI